MKKQKKEKEEEGYLFKDSKGITLVALVITIIVLLILAGVTMSMVIGDNGIITKAKEAKKKTANSVKQEQEEMNKILEEYTNIMDENPNINVPEVPDEKKPISIGAITKVNEARDADGNLITCSVKQVTDPYLAIGNQLIHSESELRNALGASYVDGMKVQGMLELTVDPEVRYPLTITFAVTGVNARTRACGVMYNGNRWEDVVIVSGDGIITLNFTEVTGPIAIIS